MMGNQISPWLEIVAHLCYDITDAEVEDDENLLTTVCSLATKRFDLDPLEVLKLPVKLLEFVYYTCGAHAEAYFGYQLMGGQVLRRRILSWMYYAGRCLGPNLLWKKNQAFFDLRSVF